MTESSPESEHADPAATSDKREGAPRKNLLLSAVIESAGIRAPVRIRNLSETGAMVDGAALPHVGAAAILRRSEIEIAATVIWCNAGRCGLEFDGVASVDEWVAGVRLPDKTFGHGQARVDAIQAAIRDGTFTAPDEALPDAGTVGAVELDARIGEEVAYVGRLLEEVGDELTDDPLVLQRHGQALQNLDIACQLLSQLAAVAGAADREAAIEAVTMGELRGRLQRKTMF